MTIWIKRDVQGSLQPIVAKAVGKVAKLYAEHGEDLYITSKREGLHSLGSLHPEGWAFDIRYPKKPIDTLITKLKFALGVLFDVVAEGNHIHIEYDPT